MVDQDGHWSDTQATVETDETPANKGRQSPVEEVAAQDEQDLTITPQKVSSDDDKRPLSPASGVAIDAPTSTGQPEDARSVQSLPVVRVTEPSEIPPTAQDAPASMDLQRRPVSPRPPRTPTSPNDPRSARRASTFPENRAGNRFSGFFTNLIHRRDVPPPTPSSGTQNEDPSISPAPSPVLIPNTIMPSVPPPPAFPSPTLQELGLDISTLTPSLSPSHFTSPPCSGAFLTPHYLLLCHAQGLDVVPLVAPPAPMSYALVRRVPFKSVVVMEQRGVLVAIAGRRDGVRVYALDEVRRAIDWRIDTEIRRERDKTRREEAKKLAANDLGFSVVDGKSYPEKSLPIPPTTPTRSKSKRRPSTSNGVLLRKSRTPSPAPPIPPLPNVEDPPAYHLAQTRDRLERRVSALQLVQRNPVEPRVFNPVTTTGPNDDVKAEWSSRNSSDEEAIDIVAAGASGSRALDERTSSIGAAPPTQPPILSPTAVPPTSRSTNRRSRPPNLDLSATRMEAGSSTVVQPPSPVPTLTAIRQTLRSHPSTTIQGAPNGSAAPEHDGDEGDDEDGLTTAGDHITLAQALLESRIPGLPPAGTRQPQQAIILGTQSIDEPTRPRTSESTSQRSGRSNTTRSRRRWSVMDVFHENAQDGSAASPSPPATPSPRPRTLSRLQPRRSPTNPPSRSESPASRPPAPARSTPNLVQNPQTPSRSRFFPRIFSEAFSGRRGSTQSSSSDIEKSRVNASLAPTHAPPPKLEYVKLPGTKGAVLIKAVETAKKSFLAILCGERGEKVELFAGTYRTALGLSRTFILPDSPRSLELQLQGDDLVEVFLVFSQNVFGLEPATVRVREVRIGRAERRAARRRARDREPLIEDILDTDPQDPGRDPDANVSVNVSVASTSRAGTPVGSNDASEQTHGQETEGTTVTVPQPPSEELAVLAAVQASPYTTFQQLSFAPNFPLASIADEFIIPPTYQEFLQYRAEHEPSPVGENDVDLSQVQFTPPGLPVPVTLPPSKWYYRDPKGIVHGPWKTQLMQAWYKDGLLPPDLPVRREWDEEYVLLRDLRLQCVDPAHPFGHSTSVTVTPPSVPIEDGRPLLRPISLLAQPAHYGPPALFFSSRGGHSTTIVDARGRLVLKGRFLWSNDEDEDLAFSNSSGRLGDVKRIEAMDVRDRAVLIALRRGGLEAIDLSDALLKPADCSRMILPHFDPPPSTVNRRAPFIWKLGTPLKPGPSIPAITALKGPTSRKKSSTGPAKSPNRVDFYLDPDGESQPEEIIFLGRRGNDLYVCERNSSSFRILHIRPTAS